MIHLSEEELALDATYLGKEFSRVVGKVLETRSKPRSAERIFPLEGGFTQDDVTYRRVAETERNGRAAEGSIDNSPADVPLVSVEHAMEEHGFWSAFDGWKMSFRERNLYRKIGRPLDARLTKVAIEALYDRENDLIWTGSNKYNKDGILSAGFLTPVALPGNFFGDDASEAVLLQGLQQMAVHIDKQTDSAYREAVTIVLPTRTERLIRQTRMSNSDLTVYDFFSAKSASFVSQITYARELDAASEANRRALAFIRDPDIVSHGRVPMMAVGPIDHVLNHVVEARFELRNTGIELKDTNGMALFNAPTS